MQFMFVYLLSYKIREKNILKNTFLLSKNIIHFLLQKITSDDKKKYIRSWCNPSILRQQSG